MSQSQYQLSAEDVPSDISTEEDIAVLIDSFYDRVLQDQLLAPLFLDVAKIDLDHHKGFIRSYWEKLLLKKPGYKRHTMNIHRALAAKSPLETRHFERWLNLFKQNLEENFQGDTADKARKVAEHIAANMHRDMVKSCPV